MAAFAVDPPSEGVRMDGNAETQPEQVKEAEAMSKADDETRMSSEMSSMRLDGDRDKMLEAMRQVESYLADFNLPYDRFMWTLHTINEEHWVPIRTVASFKHMREFQPFGPQWITNALRLSEELEVNADGTQVRRRTEVQEPKGQLERSVYAKGFGAEVDGIQKQLAKFFNKYGKTNVVRMRRIDVTREFKGSVFVEFADGQSADAFLNADPKPSWNGEELLIMSKEAYCDMKIKEEGLTGEAAVVRKRDLAEQDRKGFNAFKEMEARAKGKGKDNRGKEKIFLEFMGYRIRVLVDKDGNGGSIIDEEVLLVKGASLKFEGSGEDVSIEEIQGVLKERFSPIPFVKYSRGESSGLVGFDKALTEDEIAYVKEHLKTLNGKEVTWSIPDEDTEEVFQIERARFAARQAVRFARRGGLDTEIVVPAAAAQWGSSP